MSAATAPLSSPAPIRAPGPESEGDGWKVYPHTDGGFELAVWVAPGVRRKCRIPRKYETPDSRARFAKGAADELKSLYAEEQKAPKVDTEKTIDPTRITFGDVTDLWTSGELTRLYPDHVRDKDHADDIARANVIKEIVGDVSIQSFRIEDAERVMRSLPERARTPATRRHYAQLIRRVLALACYPLRIIEHHPLPRGFLPKLTNGKAKTFLYPSEDLKLMGAPAEKVPLVFRLLYGVLAREGMRESEAVLLEWRWLDLERGVLTLDENKTDDPRAWMLDPGVSRALAAWKKITPKPEPTDRVFVEENGGVLDGVHFAKVFRDHLHAGGIDRHELFERGRNRIPIRVHDLRGTYVTVSLANGKTEAWVTDRTGHKSSSMIYRYKRAARQVAELGLGALSPLDEAIPELAKLGPEVKGTTEPPKSDSGVSEGVSDESVSVPLHTEGVSESVSDGENHTRPLGGMAYAADLKSAARKGVRVRPPKGPL